MYVITDPRTIKQIKTIENKILCIIYTRLHVGSHMPKKYNPIILTSYRFHPIHLSSHINF